MGTVSVSSAGAGLTRLNLSMARQILEEADRHCSVGGDHFFINRVMVMTHHGGEGTSLDTGDSRENSAMLC